MREFVASLPSGKAPADFIGWANEKRPAVGPGVLGVAVARRLFLGLGLELQLRVRIEEGVRAGVLVDVVAVDRLGQSSFSPAAWRSASSAVRAMLRVIVTSTSGCRAIATLLRPMVLIGWFSSTWLRAIEKPSAVTSSAMSRVETEP